MKPVNKYLGYIRVLFYYKTIIQSLDTYVQPPDFLAQIIYLSRVCVWRVWFQLICEDRKHYLVIQFDF